MANLTVRYGAVMVLECMFSVISENKENHLFFHYAENIRGKKFTFLHKNGLAIAVSVAVAGLNPTHACHIFFTPPITH